MTTRAILPGAAVRGLPPALRLAVGFVCLSLLVASVPFVPYVERVMLFAVMLSVFLGYLFFRGRRAGFDWFEIFIPYGGFFLVAYGVGAIFYAFQPGELFRRSLANYLTPALALATAGFLVFFVGYAVRGNGRVSRSPLERWRPSGLGVAVVAGAIGFVGQMAGVVANRRLSLGGVAGGIVSAFGQFGSLFIVAWFLAWHAFWAPRRWRARDWTGFGILTILAVMNLALKVGTKEVAIVTGAIPIVAFWYVRRRLPVKTIAVLLLIVVLVIFPIYNTFRYTGEGLDTGSRLRYTVEVASRWDASTYTERTVLAFLGRLAYVTSSAAVIRDVGRSVDYKRGETLLLAPVSLFIPRLLWPDKPSIVIGREFGETFRLIHEVDDATQIGASSIGELYWNFGTAGVLLGMFFFGVLYRWLYLRYGEGDSRDDPIRRSVYVVLLTLSANIEGGIGATMAGAVKILLIVSFFFFLMRRIGFLVPAEAPRPVGGPAPGWSN